MNRLQQLWKSRQPIDPVVQGREMLEQYEENQSAAKKEPPHLTEAEVEHAVHDHPASTLENVKKLTGQTRNATLGTLKVAKTANDAIPYKRIGHGVYRTFDFTMRNFFKLVEMTPTYTFRTIFSASIAAAIVIPHIDFEEAKATFAKEKPNPPQKPLETTASASLFTVENNTNFKTKDTALEFNEALMAKGIITSVEHADAGHYVLIAHKPCQAFSALPKDTSCQNIHIEYAPSTQ